jgi:hypothetical protein
MVISPRVAVSGRPVGIVICFVIPAKAGIHAAETAASEVAKPQWIPAFAGMTNK